MPESPLVSLLALGQWWPQQLKAQALPWVEHQAQGLALQLVPWVRT